MKKIKHIIGILLILSLFLICRPIKAIALSKDSSYKFNKTTSIYKAVNERRDTSLEFNCDPRMLIPGNPDIDPKMLIPGNPDIDPKMLFPANPDINAKIYIAGTPGIDVNSPIEQSQVDPSK